MNQDLSALVERYTEVATGHRALNLRIGELQEKAKEIKALGVRIQNREYDKDTIQSIESELVTAQVKYGEFTNYLPILRAKIHDQIKDIAQGIRDEGLKQARIQAGEVEKAQAKYQKLVVELAEVSAYLYGIPGKKQSIHDIDLVWRDRFAEFAKNSGAVEMLDRAETGIREKCMPERILREYLPGGLDTRYRTFLYDTKITEINWSLISKFP